MEEGGEGGREGGEDFLMCGFDIFLLLEGGREGGREGCTWRRKLMRFLWHACGLCFGNKRNREERNRKRQRKDDQTKGEEEGRK